MVTEKRKLRPIDMAYAAMFAALMAIGANITGLISFGTVPLTMQTFFAIMAGALLGSRLGTLSMILYMIIGLIGVPVYADMSGGPGYIFHATFGFVISFIFVAFAVGKIIEAKPNPSMPRFFIACFTGLVLNYLIGTNFMYLAANTWLGLKGWTYAHTWDIMLLFLVKDIVFTVVAAVIAPRIYRTVRKPVYRRVA